MSDGGAPNVAPLRLSPGAALMPASAAQWLPVRHTSGLGGTQAARRLKIAAEQAVTADGHARGGDR